MCVLCAHSIPPVLLRVKAMHNCIIGNCGTVASQKIVEMRFQDGSQTIIRIELKKPKYACEYHATSMIRGYYAAEIKNFAVRLTTRRLGEERAKKVELCEVLTKDLPEVTYSFDSTDRELNAGVKQGRFQS